MNNKVALPSKAIEELQGIFGEHFLIDPEILEQHSHDETEDLRFMPLAVVYPEDSMQVSKLLKLCNEYSIPLTPQGARTGLSGGGLPVKGGIAMSFKRMNKILSIDDKNFMAIVEPGVITGDLQRAVMERGLFYPPDPASKDSCFIGGNVAENSGGPRAVKYGVTADYVLNLEVVLPDGSVIHTGANTLKNATGYNLTALITGSEGTLAVITKIYVKLIPHPPENLLLWVPFKDGETACKKVAEIFHKGFNPSALEFMERIAVEWSIDYSDISMELPEDAAAFLMIEIDGNNKDQLSEEAELLYECLAEDANGEILLAEDRRDKERLWTLRRNCAEGVHARHVYKEEDTVVPRFKLPELLNGVKSIGKKYGFQSVCYGHAGDGNLHVNIVRGDLTDQYWNEELSTAIREIFKLCVSLGGTLSGEHGIGYVQRPYMDLAFDENGLELMRRIKSAFDPGNILNPGKII